MDIDKISLIAQDISFAFEDMIGDKDKKELFISLFDKYLNSVDPGITTDPYDAIIALGKKDPAAFEKMVNEINLRLINSPDADIVFTGAITNYKVDPVAFTGDDQAAQNRLTISLKVNYKNSKHPDEDWNSNFTRFADFDVSQNFADVEETLIQEITDQLIVDVFNKAFVNW